MLPSKYTNCTRYMEFLDFCRSKVYPEGTETEIHHIQPRYDGGKDEDWNTIRLSLQDHWEAHKILMDEFDHWADGWACDHIFSRIIGEVTPEMKKQLSENQSVRSKKMWMDPKYRSHMKEKLEHYYSNPENIEKNRRSQSTPETIKKKQDASRLHYTDPANRERQRKNANKPEISEKKRVAMEEIWDKKHRLQLLKFPGSEKVCSKCKQGKKFVEFSKDKNKRDGLDSRCKKCLRAYYK